MRIQKWLCVSGVLVSLGGSTRAVGSESYEHIEQAAQAGGPQVGCLTLSSHGEDLPQHAQPVANWPQAWQALYAKGDAQQKRMLQCGLLYEEISALGGDLYATYDALSVAPLQEIYELLPLLYNHHSTTADFQKVTAGRYLALAKENVTHFSNVEGTDSNKMTWRTLHKQALIAVQKGDTNRAWGLDAVASHFLTDAFSGGHALVPRRQLMQTKSGQINSKILHDLDGQSGVEVINKRGDLWVAYGDGFLNHPGNAKNKQLALEALRLAKQDVADALRRGPAYQVPAVFASERLIPHATKLGEQQRWRSLNRNWLWMLANQPTTFTGIGHPMLGLLLPGLALGKNLLPKDQEALLDTTVAVAVQEVPGVASGAVNSDDEVRDWVNKYDVHVLARLPWDEKERMMQTLVQGVVTQADRRVMQKLFESIHTQEELDWLRSKLPNIGDFLEEKPKETIKQTIVDMWPTDRTWLKAYK